MLKIILLDWVKHNVASSRTYGSNWFYPKEGLLQLLKRCNSFSSTEFSIILVINDSNLVSEYDYLKGHFNNEDAIYNSSNVGQDWGGYNFGINHLRSKIDWDVILMNSACIGPLTHNWLDIYQELFHQDDTTEQWGQPIVPIIFQLKVKPLSRIFNLILYTPNMAVIKSCLSRSFAISR